MHFGLWNDDNCIAVTGSVVKTAPASGRLHKVVGLGQVVSQLAPKNLVANSTLASPTTATEKQKTL